MEGVIGADMGRAVMGGAVGASDEDPAGPAFDHGVTRTRRVKVLTGGASASKGLS